MWSDVSYESIISTFRVEDLATYCTLVSFSVDFDLEDESDTFLLNVGSHTEYTALYPRKRQHSFPNLFNRFMTEYSTDF
jgi:hypothetical protein